MKTKLDCIPCIQRQILEAARIVTRDEKIQENILRKVIKRLEDINWNDCQLTLTKKLYDILVNETGNSDPYKEIKKKSNREALELYPKLKNIINNANEKTEIAIKMAIAGNIIDFGPAVDRDINKSLNNALSAKIDSKTYKIFLEELCSSDNILYFADNCGEIVFDKLFIEHLNRKTIFVVKKSPILNDATVEDAYEVSIDKLDNVEIIEMDVGDNVNIIRKINPSIIISKGQANYEALSEVEGIYFMLIAKCMIIANELGVPLGSIVFKKNQ
jgi:uncharacterized protein with ATP-grasp and redox domains